MIKLKQLLIEKTVRLSTMKDAIFEPGRFVAILGKKGRVKLDKKSVKYLAKWIRSNSGKHGMGWSFTEGKLTEKSAISLNLWIKEFERLAKKNRMKPVDFVKKHISKRKGMDNEVVKNVLKHFQKNEGKLNEAKKLRLPNGVEATIDFKGIKLQQKGKKPVFLDRDELLKFFRGSTKYLRYT